MVTVRPREEGGVNTGSVSGNDEECDGMNTQMQGRMFGTMGMRRGHRQTCFLAETRDNAQRDHN